MSVADPAVLDALADRLLSRDAPVPLARLAEEFGCSRTQLVERIETLRRLGAAVEAGGAGCSLRVDDRLDAAGIRRALPARGRLTVAVRRVCASTNCAVRRLPVPALCVSEAQLDGRGRRGRRWIQSFGAGLMMSLSAPLVPRRPDGLAIALSMAAVECLEGMGFAGVRLKWPNDLMLADAKLGGLMIAAEGGARRRLCIGVGINVHAAPGLPDRDTAALAELGAPPSRNRLAAALSQAFVEALERYAHAGFTPFAHRFSRYDWLARRAVKVRRAPGVVNGIARGVDDSGALVVETGQRRVACRAGEVSPGAPAKEVS